MRHLKLRAQTIEKKHKQVFFLNNQDFLQCHQHDKCSKLKKYS